MRLYFSHASMETDINERLLCCGSYQFVYDEINKAIMEHRRKTNRGVFGMDEASENIVFSYFGSVSAILYRQWVADGKKLSIDEITALATNLTVILSIVIISSLYRRLFFILFYIRTTLLAYQVLPGSLQFPLRNISSRIKHFANPSMISIS